MNFKECAKQDIDNIFLADEISEALILNGKEVIGVFSSFKQKVAGNLNSNNKMQISGKVGILGKVRYLRIRNSDITFKARVGTVLDINNDSYIIEAIEPSVDTTRYILCMMQGR